MNKRILSVIHVILCTLIITIYSYNTDIKINEVNENNTVVNNNTDLEDCEQISVSNNSITISNNDITVSNNGIIYYKIPFILAK